MDLFSLAVVHLRTRQMPGFPFWQRPRPLLFPKQGRTALRADQILESLFSQQFRGLLYPINYLWVEAMVVPKVAHRIPRRPRTLFFLPRGRFPLLAWQPLILLAS